MLKFIYSICKPYRKWYIFLCLAPIFSGISFALNNYAIKIIIDTITGNILSYDVFIYPFCIFIVIEIFTRFFWSLHDYSEYKIQGSIFRDIIVKPYEYLQNHSYSYFQNNFSGSLVSKMKGLSDGLYRFWDNISHKLLENISVLICNIIVIGFLSIHLLLPIIVFIGVFSTLAFIQSKKYRKYAFDIKKNWHIVLGKLSDNITNIFTILNFAKKDKEVNEIRDFYNKIHSPEINQLNYHNFITWVIFGSIYSIMFLGFFVYMIYLRKTGLITTGVLTVSMSIILRSLHEIFSLSHNVLDFIQTLADFRASFDGIFAKQETLDKKDAKALII